MKINPLSILFSWSLPLPLLLLWLTSHATAQTPVPAPPASSGVSIPKAKIAIIDPDAFREQIEELKQKYEKLQAEFTTHTNELQAMQTTLAAQEKQLTEGRDKMTPQQIRKLSEDYERLKLDLQRKTEDYQDLARKREQEETEAIYQKIQQFLDKYTQQHSITLVLRADVARETGVIVYLAPSANITEDFIKEYNKAYPVVSAAAPKKP